MNLVGAIHAMLIGSVPFGRNRAMEIALMPPMAGRELFVRLNDCRDKKVARYSVKTAVRAKKTLHLGKMYTKITPSVLRR